MKSAIILLAIFGAVAAVDVYPTKYDTINIDSILANKRLFNNYVLCLLKKGKCSEEGGILRELIPDALITGCSKCNAIQRTNVEKVVRFLIRERHSDWDALVALYDPKGEYQHEYAHYLKE